MHIVLCNRSEGSVSGDSAVNDVASKDETIVMTDGTEYSGLEIGDLNDDKSEMSAASGNEDSL